MKQIGINQWERKVVPYHLKLLHMAQNEQMCRKEVRLNMTVIFFYETIAVLLEWKQRMCICNGIILN